MRTRAALPNEAAAEALPGSPPSMAAGGTPLDGTDSYACIEPLFCWL